MSTLLSLSLCILWENIPQDKNLADKQHVITRVSNNLNQTVNRCKTVKKQETDSGNKRIFIHKTNWTCGHPTQSYANFVICFRQSDGVLLNCPALSDFPSRTQSLIKTTLIKIKHFFNPVPGELSSWRFQLQHQSNTPGPSHQGVQGSYQYKIKFTTRNTIKY